MRELLDSVQYRPSQGKYKVYLIDEVHMLSPQSFNAMLKTLEEPPGHVIFMLATTEPNKIPKTIVSRCLQFNLKLVSDELIAENLKRVFANEEVATDDKSIDLLVELAKGSVRDSLTLADQAISHCDGNLTEPEISKLHGVLDISSTTKLFEAIFSNSVDDVINEIKRYKSLDVNYDILFDRALSFLHSEYG
jgi:DNA polymerase III, gamma/tau subunits